MATARLANMAAHLSAPSARLTGRVVLVTYASAFLGNGAVRGLLDAGASVAAHDLAFVGGDGDDKAAKARAAFETSFGGVYASPKPLLDGLVEDVCRRFGRLDVVISNDAYPAVRAPLDQPDMKLMLETLTTLTVQPYVLASQAAAQFRKQGPEGCKLIFVTSAAPLRGLPNYAPYVTARGATNALALSLAKELAPHGIAVNALAPNFVESPTYFPEKVLQNPASRAKIVANIPLGRLAMPSEAAHYLVFLASRESDFVTGQTLAFAGGWA